MTKLSVVRGSLMVGLLAAMGLCAACGADAGASSNSGAGAGPVGQGGAPASSVGGAAGTPLSAAGAGNVTSVGGAPSGPTAGGPGSGGSPSVTGGSGGTSSAGGPGAAGAPATGKTEYAPYYEIYANSAVFESLVDLQKKSGLNDVTLAFVLAGNGCATDKTVSENLDDIHAFVAAGGHVKASFGGAAGKYLEANCGTASALADAMGKFVDETGITDLDFDIEQSGVMNDQMDTMRGQALKLVQDSKHVQVSFTLSVDDDGLPSKPLAVLTKALAAGVKVTHVNIMVMDYGDMEPNKAIAPIAIGSLNATNAQLMKAIPGLTSEQAWAMLGATPDIGQNDDNEIFSLADAQMLADFAKAHKLGLIAFWNIQRDQVCSDKSGECSEHDKANFDYHNIFKKVLN